MCEYRIRNLSLKFHCKKNTIKYLLPNTYYQIFTTKYLLSDI